MDTQSLIDKAKRGDGNAFWELIEYKKASLYRMAFWYSKNEADAMDIVSEAVYKSYVSLPQLKNSEFFYTWLTRILINCAYDFSKKNKASSALDPRIFDQYGSAQASSQSEAILDLYNAIDTLDEQHRAVVILKYLEDMTITQVAEVLKIPVGTVKTYLHRSLLHLRLKLREV
jgi:RNA polymerase sigma-70 factor, ECF subfamily